MQQKVSEMPSRRLTVLVVDDSEDVRYLVVEWLRRRGIAVREAHDGHSALESLKHDDKIDLILSDLQMPRVSGLELFDSVKSLGLSSGKQIPFILMTANCMTSKREILGRGVNDFLEKPFSSQRLVECLNKIFPEFSGVDLEAS